MGAAWRGPKDTRPATRSPAMVRGVKALGLETCVTLGMLERRPGRAAEGRRPRLLQPQPRHRRRSTTARSSPPAPTRTAWTPWTRCATRASTSAAAASSAWARSRRDRAGLLRAAGQPRPATRRRADQRSGADPGHAAGRHARRSIRFEFVRTIAVARIVMPQVDGAPVGRPRADEPTSCRRCASWPAPTRSSTATGC